MRDNEHTCMKTQRCDTVNNNMHTYAKNVCANAKANVQQLYIIGAHTG